MTQVAFTLLALLAGSVAHTPRDSAVSVYGFLQPADSGRWILVLPDPLPVAGRRIGVLTAVGDQGRWPRLQDRFVEVSGRVQPAAAGSARPVLAVERVREVEPPGIVRTHVQVSFNQVAEVTLATIPNRFSWRLSDGQPSGVQPLLMYTIHNHGPTDIDFMLPTNDALCVRVRPAGAADGGATWQTTLPAPAQKGLRVVIRLGAVYQQFVSIPPEAAPTS